MSVRTGSHRLPEDPLPSEFRKAVVAKRIVTGTFEHEAFAEAQANTTLSRHPLLRTLIVALTWALLLVAWAVAKSILTSGPKDVDPFLFAGGVVGYAALTLFAAWRFMELRLKRTELTYRSVVALFALRPILGAPEAAEKASE